jgi:peptidyl-prolyl cis-trans isomerase D
MFNWIQTYLTKHFRWMLVILLAVMIVSFVFTIGNFSPLGGGGGPRYREQPFLNYDLSLAKDEQEIFGRGEMSLLMNYPSFFGPPSGEIVAQYSLSRELFLYIADQIGLPGPDKDQFKEYVHGLNGFMNFSTQEFDQTQFTAFVDSLEARGLTEAYLTGIIGEDYKVKRVQELLGGPGHILPLEAIHATQIENTTWTLETAKLEYNDFATEILPTEEDLQNFYQANSFRYLVDPKAKAAYILFDPAKNIDNDYQPEPGEISIHFFTNKARYQAAIPTPEPIKKEDGTTEAVEAPEVTLTDVEAQVIEEIRKDRADKETQRVAEEFAYTLFDKDIENGSPEFDAALANEGLTLKELVPFPESAVMMQEGLSPQTLSQVFRLIDGRYFSDPIKNGENYVLLIYQGEEPAYTPEFPEVQARVTVDFIDQEKRAKFIEKGAELKETVATAIAEGKSFADAAKAQNLSHQTFESFVRNAPPSEGFDVNLLTQLDNLNQGEVSDWVATATDGILIYAAKKEVPTYDLEAEEVKAYLEQQATNTSNVQFVIGERMAQELANTRFGQDNS